MRRACTVREGLRALPRQAEYLTRLLSGLAMLAGFTTLAAPARAQGGSRFDTGIVVGGAWLQANALPLDRDALQSATVAVSARRTRWALDAGWLRVARTLSTVQGASVSAGPLLRWRSVLFIPTVGVLGGRAQASRDSTGYNWVDAQGVSYSSAGTAGGGVGLTVECPVYRAIGIRGVASQWYFSGAPLQDDRARTLVGAGASLRIGR